MVLHTKESAAGETICSWVTLWKSDHHLEYKRIWIFIFFLYSHEKVFTVVHKTLSHDCMKIMMFPPNMLKVIQNWSICGSSYLETFKVLPTKCPNKDLKSSGSLCELLRYCGGGVCVSLGSQGVCYLGPLPYGRVIHGELSGPSPRNKLCPGWG